ncbi:MAG TPA: hypothetical protein VL098_14980 [Flavipsychrobacter sp.]|nr:hypothetical protein [Flavipsychrobacter sp.]
MQLHFVRKILSLFYPVKVRTGSSDVNPLLELFYYQGRWQLATEDALYSDGSRYRPLRLAFGAIKDRLPAAERILVLGTGLGSAVNVLDSMGFQPEITLVELDGVVLDWAKEVLPLRLRPRLKFVHANADVFVKKSTDRFDLIVIDIFNSRDVPGFVMQQDFLLRCKNLLEKNGCLVLNYIVHSKEAWEASLLIFGELFPDHKIHELGVNRIIVAELFA